MKPDVGSEKNDNEMRCETFVLKLRNHSGWYYRLPGSFAGGRAVNSALHAYQSGYTLMLKQNVGHRCWRHEDFRIMGICGHNQDVLPAAIIQHAI